MALVGKTVAIFLDFAFEDMEVMYPKLRLAEEGAIIILVGTHKAPMKYTGKYGYPVSSDIHIDDMSPSVDAIVLPGGFSPDYMRRNVSHLRRCPHISDPGRHARRGV